MVSEDASENKVYIKPTWKWNDLFTITGLASANLRLTVNGVADAIVGAIVYNATTKEYAITPTATLVAADVVTVTLADGAINTAKVGNKLYSVTTGNVVTVA